MSRKLKTVVLLLLLALMPLRAFASVTVGDCAVAQHGAADEAVEHDHDGTPHSHGDAKHDHEHCASTSFVASAMSLPLPAQAASGRVAQHEHFAAGFVPDHLDPPPLAL